MATGIASSIRAPLGRPASHAEHRNVPGASAPCRFSLQPGAFTRGPSVTHLKRSAHDGHRAAPTRGRQPLLLRASYSSDRDVVIPKSTLKPSDVVSVNRKVGEGSFGQVFEADMMMRGKETKVVMKKMKDRVARSDEMGEVEISLGKLASKKAKGATAQYLGHMVVGRKDAMPSVGLSEGLWLVWKYQGYKTLDSYLRQRDCIARLAYDLEVTEESVVPTVMKQILEALKALHAAKIVHRDVKPLNLLFCEEDRRFRFIDLGACVDMNSGCNYDPEESIFDPIYCAPEQYILPTTTPEIRDMMGPMQGMACIAAWGQQPDRFDMYSAGLILMQMAVPKLRTPSSINSFSQGLAQYEYDVNKWADRQQLPERETAILDANNGAGWQLAAALLRERVVEKGKARVSSSSAARPSAGEALRSKFFKMANKREKVPLFGSRDEADGEGQSGSFFQSVLSSLSFSDSADEELEEEKVTARRRNRGSRS